MWIASLPQPRRCEQISDFYGPPDARRYRIRKKAFIAHYPPDEMYLTASEMEALSSRQNTSFLFNFWAPDRDDWPDTGARLARISTAKPAVQERPLLLLPSISGRIVQKSGDFMC